MFNYVFCFLGVFIVNYFLRDPNANQFASLEFHSSFALPKLSQRTELHAGIFIAILFVILCYIYIYKTRWGNELRTVGDNKTFAEYIGINTIKVILCSQFIAGAIAGIGGAVEMAGMYTSFSWDVDPSYVWDGVVIALLSKNNPKYVPIAAFALSYLRIGADIMSRRSDISSEIISVIQGIVILLIAAERFLAYWKQKEENKMAKERYLAKSMEV
jgi:simple sugar transport system permease protein